MAIHYPESNLRILDYNRVLKTLNDMSNEEFISKISDSYDIEGPLPESDDLPKPT